MTISTSSVTPSTIQCTQFYPHRSSTKPLPFFFSSWSSSSSSTGQLRQQFKALQKKKSLPVHEMNNNDTCSEMIIHSPMIMTPSSSFSSDPPYPILLKGSSWNDACLDQWLANSLQSWLPRRVASSSQWNLLYSLNQHGCSLRTLYDQTSRHPSSANLIVIQTANEETIGAYLSESLKTAQCYYGSGECFLWRSGTQHQLQVYPWTSANDYMIFSNHDFLAFGGGDGHVGLFIHADLHNGHTQPCATFDNDTLTDQPYFEIIALEIWGFELYTLFNNK
ncbi:TLD-domain-containing protein [Halteromyces radiatus]|uniref:TLD-domain-containing protein n=1 Tax=Halteromyces radiatus TaxID=101107 RepID=UPI00221FA40C|nr:TLD-domain-containing protein [Halteromyces radiatus]KAI8084942.1 TLD-domain-containing protein [Halteromyces radiatus]